MVADRIRLRSKDVVALPQPFVPRARYARFDGGVTASLTQSIAARSIRGPQRADALAALISRRFVPHGDVTGNDVRYLSHNDNLCLFVRRWIRPCRHARSIRRAQRRSDHFVDEA